MSVGTQRCASMETFIFIALSNYPSFFSFRQPSGWFFFATRQKFKKLNFVLKNPAY